MTSAPSADLILLNLQGGSSTWNSWERTQAAMWPLNLEAILRQTSITNFEKYHFTGDVSFGDIRFPPTVSFVDAQFAGRVSFIDTQFSGSATFAGARFHRGVTFERAKFFGIVQFNADFSGGIVEFLSTRFYAGAQFPGAVIGTKEFRFVKCVVNREFSFADATFLSTATFAWSRFRGDTDFRGSAFRGSATFGDCIFRKRAEFGNVAFTNATFHKAVFVGDADFSTDHDHSFSVQAIFAHARFEGTARFWRREFKGITVFRWTHFEQPPEFFNAKLPDETDFEHATYGPITPVNAYSAEAAYRTLKLKMSQIQHHRAETMFFAKEMRARQFIEPNKFLEKLYRLYGYFSNFGDSVSRPLWGLLAVAIISFMLYFGATEGRIIFSCLPSGSCRFEADRGWKLLELTVAGLVPFFDVTKRLGSHAIGVLFQATPIPGYIYVLQVLELVFSLLFLFLLGLGIRNLFRLK
jgi:uncharacterized protein YjbI with pentapeptide repeats